MKENVFIEAKEQILGGLISNWKMYEPKYPPLLYASPKSNYEIVVLR